jgi:hypothetical protein
MSGQFKGISTKSYGYGNPAEVVLNILVTGNMINPDWMLIIGQSNKSSTEASAGN